MSTTATRAWTLLALGILTAISADLWWLTFWGDLSEMADRAGLAAATLTMITAVAAASARSAVHRERLRKAYEEDRDLYTLALKARLSPQHGGDGGQDPQLAERPAWVRYYPSEPAA